MENKKYTFIQKILAAFQNRSVEWCYASDVEKMIMSYKSLNEEDKETFGKEIQQMRLVSKLIKVSNEINKGDMKSTADWISIPKITIKDLANEHNVSLAEMEDILENYLKPE